MEAASMMSFCASPYSNASDHLDAQSREVVSWSKKQRLILNSYNRRTTQCVRAVAREFAKVNSRVNNTKVVGGSKLLDGKLDSTNGAATLPKETLTSSLSSENGKPLDAAVTASDVALSAVDKQQQKKAEEEVHLEKQIPVDALGRGRFVENKSVYRQTFVIRSYEVGFDKTASIETITNLFQETALNHVGMCDFVGDGMGTTHAMMRHRLIWIVTKMHIQVTRYPVWGDLVEIDSWVSDSGKNGMRRDFLIRDYSTGQILARATSNWAMMNQDTRRLSKMPDDVRAEISPFFLDRSVMEDEPCQRIPVLDYSAPYIRNGLVPKLHDMDMNQHVNHVKYIGWVLESIPQSLLVAYELKSMTLQYRRECSPSDIVSSLTRPESPLSPCIEEIKDSSSSSKASSLSEIAAARPPSIKNPRITTTGPLHYTHLLRMQCDGPEILRGRTEWRLKDRYVQEYK